MKPARIAAGVGLVLVLGVLALPYLVSAERFRPMVESRLQSAVGRPVALGALSLRVLPLSLRASGLKVAGLAEVDLLDVRVRVLPLLRGDVEVESLLLTRPVVTYSLHAPKPVAGTGDGPSITALEIVDGRLILISSAKERSEYSNIDASMRMEAGTTSGNVSWNNGTLPVKLAFAATQAGNTWTFRRLDASMGDVTAAFTGAVDTAAETVNGALRIQPSPLASLPVKSAYRPTGTVSGDVKVSGAYRNPVLAGTVQIANLQVTGGQLSQPLRASALELALTPGVIAAKPFTLQVGPTVVQAAFQLRDYKTIDANLSTRDASIRDLLAMAQTDAVSGSGVASIQVRATGALDDPQLTGSGSIAKADLKLSGLQPNLKIDTAQITFAEDRATVEGAVFHIGKSNWKGNLQVKNFRAPQIEVSLGADQLSNTEAQSWFPTGKSSSPGKPGAMTVSGDIAVGRLQLNDLVLENMKSGIRLRDQVLTLDPMTASVYGGRLAGSATMNLKTEPPVVRVKTHMEKIESEQLLAATTPLRKVVTGPLSAEAQVQFAPKAGEDISRSLDGTVQFQLAQGKLIPVNLMGELGAAARFLRPANAGPAGGTPFLGMKGQFTLKNGVAETDGLRIELDRAAAVISGALNMSDQSLNLRMLTTLNKQLSEEVGGTKIGGFLSSALSSSKGELMIPSLVRGTFSKPVFAPDAAAIGKLKLSQPGTIQDNVRGILDLFKSGKK
ncbi:MAG TPA: translocation/assembly module TamB domain-containing protein [Bryobacteraceae bacterium]|nr:translocation/assembly module TamB domain-containing protein [Bryobacteraceae bacterium]